MGDPKKKHKKYSRPRKKFDKARIEEEKAITKRYGLKNKKEILRAEAEINKIRNLAKKLIVASQEEQEKFFNRLIKLGLIKKDATIDDVLALTKEALLDRRLQTFVAKKNLAKTVKGARQLIVHRKILVGTKVIDAPSHLVKSAEENQIKIIRKEKKKKPTEAEIESETIEEKQEQKNIKEKQEGEKQ